MATISFSLPTDGSTADVADVNTPLTTIKNVINGNLDNDNVKALAAIDFSKVSGGSSTALTAWTSWTPTTTAITVGSGTLTTVYNQTGKTVRGFVKFILGAGSAVGTQPTFTLPVAAHARYATGNNICGQVWAEDNGAGNYIGVVIFASSGTVLSPGVMTTATAYANYGAFTAAIPFVWGSADYFDFFFEYEAA